MAIAIFATWTTYGTWLPGGDRGWFLHGVGRRDPDRLRARRAGLQLTEGAVILDTEQRALVESTVADHCAVRRWRLHAVNCRTNHVHAVVSAEVELPLHTPREQFKAWCTRRLREASGDRTNWWTERGWDEYIDDEEALQAVIEYVRDRQ